jgi:hypothetical protein
VGRGNLYVVIRCAPARRVSLVKISAGCFNVEPFRWSGLRSYEVKFKYAEQGVSKVALVKLRVCGDCSLFLFYRNIKEIEAEHRAAAKKERKSRKRRRDEEQEGAGVSGQESDDEEHALAVAADSLRIAREAFLTSVRVSPVHTSAGDASDRSFCQLFD